MMRACIWVALILVILAGSTSYSQSSYSGGDCSGNVMYSWRDVKTNSVVVRENWHGPRNGWSTYVEFGQVYPLPRGPYVYGQHAYGFNQALAQLAQASYYTVNIQLYTTSGWYVEGNRNALADQKAREDERRRQIQYNNQQARRNARPKASKNTGSSSTKQEERDCSVSLWMTNQGSKTEDYIDVRDEFINMNLDVKTWQEHGPWEGAICTQDRSGKERQLVHGKNWVDPGRYRVFIKHSSRVIELTARITYKGQCK